MWATKLKTLNKRRTPEQLKKRRERIATRRRQAIITKNVRVKKGPKLT